MGTKGKNAESEENKVETPAQGAEGSTDTGSVSADQETKYSAVESAPVWAQQIIESNQAVLESNKKVLASNKEVLDAVDEMFETLPESHEGEQQEPKAKTVSIDTKAKYVVSKGKKFLDKKSGQTLTQGADVSKLPVDKLETLLSLGIIEAK